MNYWKQFTRLSDFFAEEAEKSVQKFHQYERAWAFQIVKLCV